MSWAGLSPWPCPAILVLRPTLVTLTRPDPDADPGLGTDFPPGSLTGTCLVGPGHSLWVHPACRVLEWWDWALAGNAPAPTAPSLVMAAAQCLADASQQLSSSTTSSWPQELKLWPQQGFFCFTRLTLHAQLHVQRNWHPCQGDTHADLCFSFVCNTLCLHRPFQETEVALWRDIQPSARR